MDSGQQDSEGSSAGMMCEPDYWTEEGHFDGDSHVSGAIDEVTNGSRKKPAPKDEGVKRKRGRPRKNAMKPDISRKSSKSTADGQRRSSRVVEQAKAKVEKAVSKDPGAVRKSVRQQKDKEKVKASKAAKATSEKEWEVESICGIRFDDNTPEMLYLVKWKGYSSEANTWEPMENLGNCQRALRTFEAKKRRAEQVDVELQSPAIVRRTRED